MAEIDGLRRIVDQLIRVVDDLAVSVGRGETAVREVRAELDSLSERVWTEGTP